MRIRVPLLAVMTVLLAGSGLPGPAVALQPGVYINPGSPAGREYSFPLEVLRGAAVGRAAPQGVAQPLFGVGIAAVSAGGRAGTAGGGPGAVAHPATARGRSAGARGTTHAATSPASRSRARARASGPIPQRELAGLIQPRSSTTQVAVLGLVVLLAGTLLGVAMVAARRRG